MPNSNALLTDMGRIPTTAAASVLTCQRGRCLNRTRLTIVHLPRVSRMPAGSQSPARICTMSWRKGKNDRFNAFRSITNVKFWETH